MATSGVEGSNSSTPEAEVDGRIEPSRKSQPLCTPCDSGGRRTPEAVGYCVNCKEFLCETCFKYHRRPSHTCKHVLLDQTQMPSATDTGNCCTDHDYCPVEYYCPDHPLFGCHGCFDQHLKTCNEAKLIADVANDLPNSEEFKEFAAKLNNVDTKTTHLIQDVNRSLEYVDKLASDAIDDIKTFKLEVLAAADRLEKELFDKVEVTKEADTTKLKDVLKKCESLQETRLRISTEIAVLQNRHHNVDLYLAVINNNEKLESLEGDLVDIERGATTRHSTFERNSELLEALKSPFALGTIVDALSISSAEHVTDIKVKTETDTSGCCIRGSSIMPDGYLVIADNNNKSVKLVDTMQSKTVSEVKLTNRPWSVARVTDNLVAVTVPVDKKIAFIRTDPAFGVDREVSVKEKCYGLAYCDGKLITTCCTEPYKVQVMNLQGTVLREIQTDGNGKALFPYSFTVTVNHEQDLMYISNVDFHNVTCLNLDGTVVATYTDNDFKYPRQAAVTSSGMLFVLAHSSKNVHLITHDCKKVKVLLSSRDGLYNPQSLSYDDARRRLYVSSGNIMKIYQLAYSTL